MDAPSLQYHQEAAQLLGIPMQISQPILAELEQFEAVNGRMLPGAVREYYALADADELLTIGDQVCGVIPRAAFLTQFSRTPADDYLEFFGPRRVNTGYQGYILLDGSGDPPVVADGMEEPEAFSKFVLRLARYKMTGEFR